MAQKLVPIAFKIYQGETLVRTETIAQNVIKIGRDQKSHLRVEDDTVSRMHAVIEAKPEEVQIIDLGSGTYVNGQPVNKCALHTGDEIRIGNARIVVDIGQPVDEATVQAQKAPAPARTSVAPAAHAAVPTPSVPPPSFVAPPFSAPGFNAGTSARPPAASVDGDEIYQLIKRGDINPHEVEEVGSHAVEVSILWKNAILHVAHLDGTSDFVLAGAKPKMSPAGVALAGGLFAGTSLIVLSIALSTREHPVTIFGALGTLVAFAGSGAGIALDQKNDARSRDASRFIVGSEILQSQSELAIVLNRGGATRFVFAQGSSGEVDLDGQKRSLQDLIAGGQARTSGEAPGAHEVDVRPNGRYKMELGGLTVLVKVVAPGRRVAGGAKRDPALIWSMVGAAAIVLGSIGGMIWAVAEDNSFLSQGNDEDRLNELRAFIARQQERQPEQQQQNNDSQQEGGTGTRHAGPEGKMGKRDAPSRSARYAIRNNGEPPHLSRAAAREAVQNRGIFAALSAPGGGMSGGQSGIVSPFGGLTESGVDNQNANGNMTGDAVGDAFGYGGLGATGTGWGGGGTGRGPSVWEI